MAIEEQKAEDLLGLENEDIEESTDEEGSEDDRRFSKRHVRQTQDLLAVARSSNEDDESSDESDSDAGDEEDEDEEKKQQPTQKEEEDDLAEENHDGTEDEEDEEEGHDTKTTKAANEKQWQDTQSDKTTKDKKKKKNKKIKPLTPEEIEKFEKEQKRSGVCYLSSIPSYMSPSQLRQHLSKYAEIGRTYMVPQKGEKKKNKLQKFVEGWVEFKDKRKAKALAEYLNMRQVGGKRKNPFYFDTWNIKYLPKFKWHHLTEQMAYERKARQHRLEAEIAQAARENKAYIENVQRSKMIKNMEERRKRKRKDTDQEEEGGDQKIRRTFFQRGKPKQGDVSELLGNVFGS